METEQVIVTYMNSNYDRIWSEQLQIPDNYNSIGAIGEFKDSLKAREQKPFNADIVEMAVYIDGSFKWSEDLTL